MKKITIYFGFFCLICSLSAQTVKLDLNSNWQFRKKGDTQWLKATVPGTVHTDLIENKKIEDPFYRTNEKDLQWIGTTDWEYKSEFTVDDKILSKERVQIQFDGLDTYADVFVNGVKVLKADNMFVGWKVDVKKQLKSGLNTMSIMFYSPINKVMSTYKSLP